MEEFSFLINVCNDVGKAIHLYREITWYFPDIYCDVVFDGYDQQQGCDQFNWTFRENTDYFMTHLGEHLKPVKHGTKWISRYLKIFEQKDVEYLIKLDPDCEIFRHFEDPLPDADYFGTFIHEHIQGGVKGISKKLAKYLIEAYVEPQNFVIPNKEKPHLVSEDLTMMHTIKTLQSSGHDIVVKQWEEVCSFYGRKPINPWMLDGHLGMHDRKYAITHPR
jgi:hypothetical protein